MASLGQALLILSLVPASMAATPDCKMDGTAWETDKGCSGSPFTLTLPDGQRKLSTCVTMGKAGQAGDPNRMCIKAKGCSDTDSADCVCTLHCACGVSADTGAKSCITKAAVNPTTCDAATCAAASAASRVTSHLVGFFTSVAMAASGLSLL